MIEKNNSEHSLNEVHKSVHIPEKQNRWRTYVAFLGPAYLVSVGYMDPGNWATDIAGGSKLGYGLIWVLFMSNLMALLLQTLSTRLGIVKGWDLAQASRQQYTKWVNFSLYVFAEIAIAACDLAEIIGMAIGLNLLFKLPMLYGVLITALDTFLLLFLINKGIRKLELFIISMVSLIGLSFIVELLIVHPSVSKIASGFIPQALSGDGLYIAIGIIGATVMPHNLYLHSALVQTRKFRNDKVGIRTALKYNFMDSALALNLAFFVNAAILILAASAFHSYGYFGVSDIKDAHILLKEIFGNWAPTLFAFALICSGQSSTITGTLAGQVVMEGYLNLRISPWLRRMITRLLAIIPALITLWLYGEDDLGNLLILSQVVLSLQLGFAVIPLIHFTGSKKIMGEYVNKPWIQLIAWTSAALILILNGKLVYETLHDFLNEPYPVWLKAFTLLATAYAAVLLMYIIILPLKKKLTSQPSTPHAQVERITQMNRQVYKRISIAVDYTPSDINTIEHALVAGGKNAEYHFIHIVESAVARRYGAEVMDSETQNDLENLKQYVNDLVQLGYTSHCELGFGNRAVQISNLILKNRSDLLVMGAHGHNGFKDFVFGTTVESVRHKVKIPVLVVKQ